MVSNATRNCIYMSTLPPSNRNLKTSKEFGPIRRANGLAQEERRQIRRATDRVHELAHASLAALTHVGCEVIVTDIRGKVAYHTDRAPALLKTCNNSILLRHQSLIFLCKEHNLRINQFVSRVAQGKVENSAPDAIFFVQRANQLPPITVSLFPLFNNLPCGEALTFIMYAMRDTEHQRHAHWRIFARQFLLTGAELRLCKALHSGLSVAQHAANCCVTSNTVRTQLKSIFDKTNVRRQSDLLLLIVSYLY